jgi:hypothetical protein
VFGHEDAAGVAWCAQGAQRISGFTPVSGAGGFGLAGVPGVVGVVGAPVPGGKPEKPPPPSPPPQAERAQASASAEKSRTEGKESRMVGSLVLSCMDVRARQKKGAMEAPRTGQTARLGKTRYIAMKKR